MEPEPNQDHLWVEDLGSAEVPLEDHEYGRRSQHVDEVDQGSHRVKVKAPVLLVQI